MYICKKYRIMIAEKIREILTTSHQIIEKSEEERINEYLDFINDIKKDLSFFNTLFDELQEYMYSVIQDEPNEIWANIDLLSELLKETNVMLSDLRSSTIYAGIKSSLKELSFTVGLCSEIRNDIIYRYKISKSQEHQELNKRLAKFL